MSTLGKDLEELQELKEKAYQKGVFTTHVLYEKGIDRSEGLAFINRVKGDNNFYLMNNFAVPVNWEIVDQWTKEKDRQLIPLGPNGISIRQGESIKILEGELYLCGNNSKTRIEDILRNPN